MDPLLQDVLVIAAMVLICLSWVIFAAVAAFLLWLDWRW
jgi:hypothetical protein